jgi:hypothetical protein
MQPHLPLTLPPLPSWAAFMAATAMVSTWRGLADRDPHPAMARKAAQHLVEAGQ